MIANEMEPFPAQTAAVLKTISHSIQTVGTVILANHISVTLSNVSSILCML
jgi:hypothetical protein